MINTHGTTSRQFHPVRKAFRSLWNDVEVGAALTVFKDGEPVVDLWAGYCDRDQDIAWRHDTLVNIYSSTKGIVAMAIACLVEDGLIAYDDPVSKHWPEFGSQSKFDITISQLLSHQAGLFETGLDDPLALLDRQTVTRRLAAMQPAWQPAAAFGYHAVSWGYLAGELIRRVTGLSAGGYIALRIAGPLQAEVHLGLDEASISRCAQLIGPNHARREMAVAPAIHGELSAQDPVLSPFKHLCTDAFRQAEIPATNGHASSLGLAQCYQAMLNGRLVSAGVLEAATTELTNGQTDLVLGTRVRRSNGFILNSEVVPMGSSPRSFGHSGTGGSIAFADPDNRVVFAYVMNQLHASGPARYRRLVDAVYGCL